MTDQRPVLVVDDDPALREVIQWSLVDEGYPVVTAGNGVEALERVHEGQPLLILLDMRMPIMDGWGFARAYREQPGAHAPIVVITAARDAAEWAQQVDAAGFLAKPFAIEDLLDTVKRQAEA
jgi:two-component system chemotaxis response regulator CheY